MNRDDAIEQAIIDLRAAALSLARIRIPPKTKATPEELTQLSYKIEDAMIKAREGK